MCHLVDKNLFSDTVIIIIYNIILLIFYFSAIAVNLKACNHFRLYNGKAAEVTLYHSNN